MKAFVSTLAELATNPSLSVSDVAMSHQASMAFQSGDQRRLLRVLGMKKEANLGGCLAVYSS